MNVLSVCSGIGAPEAAWSALGWNFAACSEIDAFPSAVMAHHYPDVPNWGDMTKWKDWPDANVDVLVGGTPCQSFSVAGLRKGLDDPRGNLALTYLAIAHRYRPRWLVWENVPGVLSSNGGRDFGAFLGALGQLGYGFAYRVLDAQYFGLAQRRRRVFVVGHLGDLRRAAAVLFEPESLSGHPAPSRKAGQGIAAATAPSLTASGRGVERAGESGSGRINAESETFVPVARSVAIRGRDGVPQVELGDDKANAIVTPNGGRGGIGVGAVLAHTLRARYDGGEDGTGRGVPIVFDTTQITSKANRSNPEPGDPCHPITAGGHAPTVAEVADTLTAHWERSKGAKAGNQVGVLNPIIYPSSVRRLMPVECERLQGFPDHYTAITYRGKPAADGPRYKALGNSMAVPVVRWVGARIEAVTNIEAK